jgi:hypothetical protein
MAIPAQVLLASVREKQAEAARLYRTLDLWAAVQAQGSQCSAWRRLVLTPRC